MELVLFFLILGIVGLLASMYGVDSRDGTPGW